MTTLRDQLIVIADAYAAAQGLSRARVSTIVFNAGASLDRIASGRDLNTRSFERAMRWFSENWPDGTSWPDEVPRPTAEAA